MRYSNKPITIKNDGYKEFIATLLVEMEDRKLVSHYPVHRSVQINTIVMLTCVAAVKLNKNKNVLKFYVGVAVPSLKEKNNNRRRALEIARGRARKAIATHTPIIIPKTRLTIKMAKQDKNWENTIYTRMFEENHKLLTKNKAVDGVAIDETTLTPQE